MKRRKDAMREDKKTPREKMRKLKFQMASFRMAFFRLFALKFRLFAWRVSSFRMALFRLFAWRFSRLSVFFAWRFFVFLSFRVASFRHGKTKWHESATIYFTRCSIAVDDEMSAILFSFQYKSSFGERDSLTPCNMLLILCNMRNYYIPQKIPINFALK